MTARTHDLAAITALAVAVLVYSPANLTLSTVFVSLFANQLGGIAPDVDQPTAPFWHNLPEGHFVGRVFGRLLGGHRFISHSILGFALFAWLCNLLLHFLHPVMESVDIQIVWLAFIIGYASHLVMDTFTKEGVPWLLPVPYKVGFPPLKKFRITTGKCGESLLVFPALIALDIWLFTSHYEQFLVLFHHLAH